MRRMERIAALRADIAEMEGRGNEQALGQLYALLHKTETEVEKETE